MNLELYWYQCIVYAYLCWHSRNDLNIAHDDDQKWKDESHKKHAHVEGYVDRSSETKNIDL